MEFLNIKGTREYKGKEAEIRRELLNILEKNFKKYGFSPIETPILEYKDFLVSKYSGGDEITKEIYTLSDRGNREIALRYDLTMPFIKFFINNKNFLSIPYKRYEIGKVFRDGPIKSGRYREFTQCDIDIIDDNSMLSELQLFLLCNSVFSELNIPIYIEYNNRNILYGILKNYDIPRDKYNSVLLIVDKIKKIDTMTLQKELLLLDLNDTVATSLISLITNIKTMDDLLKLKINNDMFNKGIKDLIYFQNLIEEFDLTEKTIFNPFLSRGLDIYTDTVYEIFYDNHNSNITSSLGSGGRYNNVIKNFANDSQTEYPAVGMSFGLDIISLILTNHNNNMTNTLKVLSKDYKIESIKVMEYLRSKGFFVDSDFSQRKLNKKMNSANKEKINYIVIIEEDEIKNNYFNIKNMFTGDTEKYEFKFYQHIK